MTEPIRCTRRCTHNRLYDHTRCYDLTAADLLEMVELYVVLHTRLTPSGANTDRISGSRERPLGVSVEVLSFIGAPGNPLMPAQFDPRDQVGPPPMLDTLMSWAATIAADRGLTPPGPSITSTSLFLTRHHDWASRQDWSADYGEEIRDCAHHARMLAQLYPARPVVKPGIPCRNCDALGLIEELGEDRIVCPACGLRLTNAEYTDWVKLLAVFEKTKKEETA